MHVLSELLARVQEETQKVEGLTDINWKCCCQKTVNFMTLFFILILKWLVRDIHSLRILASSNFMASIAMPKACQRQRFACDTKFAVIILRKEVILNSGRDPV